MKNTITIIGAGRTGRGMFGELFFSDGRYQINFADNDPMLVNQLRKQGFYHVEMQDLLTGSIERKRIDNFKVFDITHDRDDYLNALSESSYIATALFPEDFDSAINDIVSALKIRIQKKINLPITILLGANYVGLFNYFYPKIISHFKNSSESDYFDRYVAVLTTNANRKIVFPDFYPDDDKCLLRGDNKPVLMVEDNFKFSPEYQLPNFFKPIKNIEINMIEKIWSENLEHISLGFLGNYYGYKTINEAISCDHIRKIVYYAWYESRQAMFKKYGIPIPDNDFKQTVYQKFASPYFADKLNRIARDTKRKLKKNDRLLGPIFLCLEMGIIPFFITKCLAYGFYFNEESIEDSKEIIADVQKIGIREAVIKYCQLDINNPKDKYVLDMVESHYKDINDYSPIKLKPIKIDKL